MGRLPCKLATTLMLLAFILLRPVFLHGQGNTLSVGTAGPLEIGMSINDLYQAVGKQNTKLVDAYSEGYFSPVIEIYKGSSGVEKPAVVAEVMAKCPTSNSKPSASYGFIVGRITVNDPQLKTNVGIGVGSTLGEIRRWYKVDWITFGEGPLVARVEEIQMSFALDYSMPSEEWYRTHDQALIPDTSRVISVLLTLPPAEIASRPQPRN
jgi:hypothetical protein